MTKNISLRIAGRDDAAAIRDLTRAAYAKWVAVLGREPAPMTANYFEAVRKHRFDLLYDGEILTALIETVPQDGFLLIENVAVLPACQGYGHGKRLLALAEELAADAGLSGTRLYTNKLMASNIALYRSMGYRIEREEERSNGIKVHMVKARVTPSS